MKDWVKKKLEEVEMLFPPERLEKSKARIAAIWRGERPPDRYPVTYYPVSFEYYNDVHTPEQRLKSSFDEFIIHGKLNDDFIPSFFPGCRQATIPNMFGAPEIIKGNDFTCEKIVHSSVDIDSLPDAVIAPGSLADQWLRMQEYFLEETDGRIPIHVTDMQGPADVCGQLWSYDELFVCALTEPDRYHALMNKATDAFLLLWRKQKEVTGDQFLGTHLFGWNWVPPDNGVTISADSLVMVSPEFYDEFYKPYFVKLGESFGGAVVHSCGDFSQTIPPLMRTPGIRGINASQMTAEQLVRAGVDGSLLVIAITSFDDARSFFSFIKDKGLNADVTVYDIWPQETDRASGSPTLESVVFRKPETWTSEDWDFIRRREDLLMEIWTM